MSSRVKPPARFWVIIVVLIMWEAMGCFACVEQVRLGAAAMGSVDDWSLRYYSALPFWYNGVYAVATFGALLGGLALLKRDSRASLIYRISFVAILVMFGYAFAATDLVQHKGLGQVLPFPIVIVGVGAFSIWFAKLARIKAWID